MKDTTDNIGEVSVRPLTREMQDRYLSYAISTITGRALPDARDGLKPVQRRILYAMADLKLSSSGAFRKSAKIAGDVMGNYHPHGDSAIYDAMVRMAQGFSMREPLVDGQGNFGNIDGDSAAASRYTEARMTRSAEMLLKDISEDAVPMRSNYDGSSEEPEVLPAAFPNILVNGSSGIAVGMATNIPPHEPKDAIAATIALMKDPAIPGSELAAIIRGPDFPTGGVLVEDPDATLNAYETGRGTFRLRSKWAVEDAGKAGWVVVVTEIPYQVQKLRLMERLVELADDKSKLPLVADVRDESSEDVRIVIEPKSRSVDPAMMMASLFATSDLEIRFQMNMNVLLPGLVPKVCGLKEVLSVFVGHREETLLRRSRHGLGKAVARMSVLEGYLIAYVNLDEVIRIIREASDPGAEMRARFGMTQDQTEAVLSMRLRSLRRLEEEQIVKDLAALRTEKARLEGLIDDPDLRRSEMISEMVSASVAFGDSSRRTAIEADTSPRVDKGVSEAFVAKEPLTVTLSAMGWVKSVKGTGRQDQDMKFRDGDGPLLTCQAFTTDDVLIFSSDGRVFSLRANDIPGGRGFGEAVRMMTDLPQDASVVAIRPFRQDGRSLMVSSSGTGMIVADQQVIARTRTGKRVMTLDDGATLIASIDTDGFDTVVTVSNDDRMLSFPLSEVPEVAKGRGVWLQRGAGISAVRSVALAQSGRPLRYALSDGSFAETTDLSPWSGRRSGAGRKAPVGVSRLLTARC